MGFLAPGPVILFLPAQQEPPATNPATFGALTAATGQRPYLEFDGTTNETAIMSSVLRSYRGGNLQFTVYATMDTANTGTKVVKVTLAVERLVSGDVLGAGGNDFAAAQSVEITVNNTAGTLFTGTLSLTSSQIDGLLSGELFRLKVVRDNATTGTNATGRLRILAIVCQEVAA